MDAVFLAFSIKIKGLYGFVNFFFEKADAFLENCQQGVGEYRYFPL